MKDNNEYEKTVKRLTILLSKGEISQEAYMKAIKTIEEKLGELPSECPQCGQKVPKDFQSCPYCGWSSTAPSPITSVKKPTAWWYLVPILLALIGGLVGYIAVKDENKEMADTLLAIGIVMTVVNSLIIWALL